VPRYYQANLAFAAQRDFCTRVDNSSPLAAS